MAKKQKVNQVMVGIGLLMMAAIILVFTLWLALLPASGGKVISPILGAHQVNSITLDSPIANVLLWLFIPIPAIFAFEGGLRRLREGLEMRKHVLNYKPKTIWSKFAAFNQFMDILNTGFFMLIFVLLFALAILELWYSPKVVSLNMILYIASVVVYLLIRKRMAGALATFTKKTRKGMPTYKLTEDGVTSDILPPPTLRLEVGASWDVPTNVGMITKLSPFAQRFFVLF